MGGDEKKDELVWNHTKSGKYTTKSGYRFLLERRLNHQTSKPFWRNFWKMELIPAWAMFMWKLINRAFPSCTSLRKRGVGVDALCSVCRTMEETVEHRFRDCSVVQHVWRASSLGINSGSSTVSIGLWVSNFLTYLWKHDSVDDNQSL